MGKRGLHVGFWWKNQKERDHWEELDVSRKIILRRILENRMGWNGLDSSGSGQRPVEGSCEHGNEPSGSIKCWEILE
jgi:hypothetical protein